MMLNGIKEKNSAVRAACEQALIALFRLRNENPRYDDYLSAVEVSFRFLGSRHFRGKKF